MRTALNCIGAFIIGAPLLALLMLAGAWPSSEAAWMAQAVLLGFLKIYPPIFVLGLVVLYFAGFCGTTAADWSDRALSRRSWTFIGVGVVVCAGFAYGPDVVRWLAA